MSSDRIEALRKALELTPDNYPLRQMLAEALEEAGETLEAVEQYERLLASGKLAPDSIVQAGMLALEIGRPEFASRCLEAARSAGVTEGVDELEEELEANLARLGGKQLVRNDPDVASFSIENLIWNGPKITFADVGGLDEVKKNIHRRIILPFQRPDLYQKYGRRAGGGVLLYGPPGCGKTLLARATAGECNLPFLNIRIEDILDPYYGVSEQNLHKAFELARLHAPCVVFIDELDAIAFARKKHTGSAGRPLVDQILQELDAIGSDNTNLLVLGATNAPWDVDDGLKRPGRFDRMLFVPPPDEEARYQILKILLASIPALALDLRKLARSAPLFSGADLRSLTEQAVDLVIDEALDTGKEPPVSMRHLEQVLTTMRPSTMEWLVSARNYVEFANQAGQYDDVSAFLKSRDVKRWRD